MEQTHTAPAVKEEAAATASAAAAAAPVTPASPAGSGPAPPVHEMVGGSSVRQYLNQHLTLHLLAGLKEVGRAKPEDPLRWLGEYLIARANDPK